MNKAKLIWGIICLAVAGLLLVLIAVLPDGKITFMVDGTDMPYIPPIVLGIIGIALIATARSGTQEAQPIAIDEEKAALNKRLETIGWGCFLVMLGGFIFVPHMVVAKGSACQASRSEDSVLRTDLNLAV